MFKDEVFDSLDAVSQMIEPYEYSFNEVLASAPNEVTISPEDIIHQLRYNIKFDNVHLGISSILHDKWKDLYPNNKIDALYLHYEFQSSRDPIINIGNTEMIGDIKIVKAKDCFTDDELKTLVETKIVDRIRGAFNSGRALPEYVNEVADIFNIKDVAKTRSMKRKNGFMRKGFKELFADNKLPIKDVDLSERVGIWIQSYCISGNLGAMRNLCKLKILTHTGRGIYSIQDEVVL